MFLDHYGPDDLLSSQYGASLLCARVLFVLPGGGASFKWLWIVQDGSGLLRLIGEFRVEEEARRLARRMLEVVGIKFVAGGHVWL